MTDTPGQMEPTIYDCYPDKKRKGSGLIMECSPNSNHGNQWQKWGFSAFAKFYRAHRTALRQSLALVMLITGRITLKQRWFSTHGALLNSYTSPTKA